MVARLANGLWLPLAGLTPVSYTIVLHCCPKTTDQTYNIAVRMSLHTEHSSTWYEGQPLQHPYLYTTY